MAQDIELAKLIVDLTNYRIGDFTNERDSMRALLAHQKQKIARLARDILDLGMNPAEQLMVMPHPELVDRFVVLEGNRRITALKVLDEPDLAIGTPVSRRKGAAVAVCG